MARLLTSRAETIQRTVLAIVAIALSVSMARNWTITAPAVTMIDYQPSPAATILGGRAVFTVIASGDAPFTYQWRKDAVDLSNGPKVAGATTDALILSNVSAADAGDYSVVVTGVAGSATSSNAALTVGTPQAGDVDFSFDPGSSLNSVVYALALQADGKTLIGGDVTSLSGAARGSIARLNSDGSTDHTFGNGLAGANEAVFALAVQSDGRALIGGDFTTVNGVSRNYVARLNADGSLDTTFLNGLAGANGTVRSLALQPDGRVLIGGEFTSVNGVSRGSVARLNADGSLDTTFLNGLAGANGVVFSLAVQPDGRVLMGGYFATVNGESRSCVARLNADGSLDTTFLNGLAGADDAIFSLAVQSDGRVLIGGFFSTVNGVSRNFLARLEVDGSLDTTFLNGLAGMNSWVNSLVVQPDSRVLIGGEFTTVNGVGRNRIARLNTDGSLDTSFLNALGAGVNVSVFTLAVQPDGRVLMGGGFMTVNGTSCYRVARLNADGTRDTSFFNGLAGFNGEIRQVVVQPDGRVVISGYFSAVGGVSRSRIVRLNGDGSLDTNFLNGLTGANTRVFSLAVQPDARVVIGGLFTRVNGVTRNSIARLNADGSLDTSFLNGLAGVNGRVYYLTLQPDGRVLIGGEFTTVNGVGRNFVARLNADGSLDTTFLSGLPGPDDSVQALAVQSDGRVLIGGFFATVDGVSRNNIARVNADGSLDTSFLNGLAGANGWVRSIVVRPDGRLLIGGEFTSVNGVSRNRIARLNADGSLDTTFLNGLAGANGVIRSVAVQPDGHVLIGGDFTTVNGVSRNRIARLNADGSLDTIFLNGLAGVNDSVFSLAVQPDGGVLLGGFFGGVNGVPRTSVARMYGSAPPPIITVEPSSQVSYDGCGAVFHVEASGGVLQYQWRKNGLDLVDGGAVSGASSATLRITGLTSADQGDYSVVVSNAFGSDTSAVATLTLASVPECKIATDDPVLGCVLIAAADGTSCADGNACTSGDSCNAGVCGGACVCLTAGDTDGDGFGDPGAVVLRCDAAVPPGYAANTNDCNDANPTIHPGAAEVCNLVDDDCDVAIDEGVMTTFYADADGDSYGDASSTTQACVAPAGYSGNALDCDDTDPMVRPAGPEICDGKRNDCNGAGWPAILDDDADLVENACDACTDGDGDGYGDPGLPGNLCAADNCPLVSNADQLDDDFDGRGDVCDVCPLDPMDDQDADGLCGDVDNCPGSANAGQDNADSDALGDACDACPLDVANDADDDGACESADNCPTIANPTQVDADSDTRGDACDACPLDAANDTDADGVCGNVDNCPAIANADQANADGDAPGDACDPCPLDAANDGDGDGLCGDVDNCPSIANADQANADADAQGDLCDACPLDAANDVDGDGFCASADNCPVTANPNQTNGDNDALGDACDACPLDAANDVDGDGVCANVDNCPAIANADQANADGDGAGDACDPCPLDAANDGDGDGLCGDVDNCPSIANADQANADADAQGDLCDACPLDAANDVDGDGFCASADNCPVIANPNQTNGDNDALGDACDACPLDAANDVDGDGVCANVDNCPAIANADQANADGDGVGDACDPCPLDAANDGDGDGLCGDVDNCPSIANADQANADADAQGDLCDACPLDAANDVDGDGFCASADNCPVTANPNQTNGDNDALGDACDACPLDAANDVDGDGVCANVDNCPAIANADQANADGDGVGDACDLDVDGDGLPNETDADDDNDTILDDDDNCPLDFNSMQLDHDNDGIGDACDTADGIVGGGTASKTAPGAFTFSWEPEGDTVGYNVYSGTLDELHLGSYGSCFRSGLVTTYTTLDSAVPPDTGRFYLVTAKYSDHEGSLGYRSDGSERPLPPPCP